MQEVLHSASLGRDECGAGQSPLQAEETLPSGLRALSTLCTKIIAASKFYYIVLFWTSSSYYICDLSGAFTRIWSSQNFMQLLSSTWFVKYLMLRAILQKTLCFSDSSYLYGTSVLHRKGNVLITFFPCAQFNENCLFIPFLIPQ